MKTLAAVLIGMVATTEAFGQEAGIRPQAPVIVHSIDGTGPCGTGIVQGLDPSGDGFLAVKAGPGLRYDRIDKLYNGEEVAICATAGDWLGVVYTRRHWDCNVFNNPGWSKALPYTGPCRSGWVHKRWVEPTSG